MTYPAGTLIGRYYRNTYDQGHVAVVLANGRVLQSFANARGGRWPGVNSTYTVAQSHDGGYYEYAVRPKDWLGGTSGGGSSCRWGNGLYCGQNSVGGDSTKLYQCTNGRLTLQTNCASGCVREVPGVADRCAARSTTCKFGDGLYCGSTNGVAGDPKTLYRCTSGRITEERRCANACVKEAPGVADRCR
jgi:hypothetical protein